MAKNSIKGLLQGIAQEGAPGIVTGKVEKLSPLKVRLVTDQKILLSAVSLVIPDRVMYGAPWCQCSCHCPESGPCNVDHNHKLKRALKVDDVLYLLVLNNGKLYYALDRK